MTFNFSTKSIHIASCNPGKSIRLVPLRHLTIFFNPISAHPIPWYWFEETSPFVATVPVSTSTGAASHAPVYTPGAIGVHMIHMMLPRRNAGSSVCIAKVGQRFGYSEYGEPTDVTAMTYTAIAKDLRVYTNQ